MLTDEEIREITDLGKSAQNIQKQLEEFKSGFPILTALSPATIGDGIIRLTNEECIKYADSYERSDLEIVKFVPASGAASFRLLQSCGSPVSWPDQSD